MSPWKQKATTAGGATEIPKAGSHPAVLIGMIDLGTHEETFEDKDKGTSKTVDMRKVLFAWELTAEPISGHKDGRNHVLVRDYNAVFSQRAALRKMVEGWRGKSFIDDEDFDLQKLLGQKCMVTVKHGTSSKGNTFAKLDGIAPVPKGMAVPEPKIKPFAWAIGDGEFPDPQWLPFLYGEAVRDKISRSKEIKNGEEPVNAGVGAETEADQVPF